MPGSNKRSSLNSGSNKNSGNNKKSNNNHSHKNSEKDSSKILPNPNTPEELDEDLNSGFGNYLRSGEGEFLQ